MANGYDEGFYRMGFNVVDSSMFMPCFSLSSPSVDWDHQLSFIEENNLDDMIIEDLPSKPYFHRDQEHKGSINQYCTESSTSCPSSLLTCLLESDRRRNLLMDGRYSLSSSEVHHEINNLPMTSFDPLMDTVNEPTDNQFVQQLIEMKSDGIITSKAKATKPEGGRTSFSSAKKTSLEPAVKKPRIEMPSPLPTFNVRKDKLQDRITALQQLVSPFGKTDTASVLQEAIQYIKFLHDQIRTLNTPYLRSDYPVQHHKNFFNEEGKSGEELIQDLKSRGLCLVPISSIIPFVVAPCNNDFWSPPFGGFYK